MKIAIYARVSTNEQFTENQVIRLKEYADRMGYTYDVFEETESSRKTRPIKAKVLDLLRKKEYDAVLVYKLDRWARSLSELILEITELTSKGTGFISFRENLDLTTPTGRLQFGILSCFAEFERDIISQRTKEGMNRAKLKGVHCGRPKKGGL